MKTRWATIREYMNVPGGLVYDIFPCQVYYEYDGTMHWELKSWSQYPRFRGLRHVSFRTRKQAEAKLKGMGLELVVGLEVTEAHQCQLMLDELEETEIK